MSHFPINRCLSAGSSRKNAKFIPVDPAYREEHAESVDLWSPGSAVFKAPESLGEAPCSADSLRDILAKATGT